MCPSLLRVHASPLAVASSLDACVRELDAAAADLYAMDPQIVSVGIGLMPGGYGLRVVRHVAAGVRSLRQLDPRVLRAGLRGLAIDLHDTDQPIRPLVKLRSSTLTPGGDAAQPEQARQRPLCAGSQLQNWDCDEREGLIANGELEVGTLGMLVPDADGCLLLSNNHVLAGQNHGQLGDRIAQPGGERIDASEVVARLERYVALQTSPRGAQLRFGNVVWNHVDAAIARVSDHVPWHHGFLGRHRLPQLRELADPQLGDEVFKVGRTTGLRRGRIVAVAERIGPVGYAIGDCWFRDSFTIEGLDGLPFSDGGDSGATIVRRDGTVLGLLYAGNGEQTHACPIRTVFEQLGLAR